LTGFEELLTMKNCTICLMEDQKIAAVMRALEYETPVRTVAALLDVSKDVVARHKAHMYDPPTLRRRRSRSRMDLFRQIARDMGMPEGAARVIKNSL
jgi:hypothetical protein